MKTLWNVLALIYAHVCIFWVVENGYREIRFPFEWLLDVRATKTLKNMHTQWDKKKVLFFSKQNYAISCSGFLPFPLEAMVLAGFPWNKYPIACDIVSPLVNL